MFPKANTSCMTFADATATRLPEDEQAYTRDSKLQARLIALLGYTFRRQECALLKLPSTPSHTIH